VLALVAALALAPAIACDVGGEAIDCATLPAELPPLVTLERAAVDSLLAALHVSLPDFSERLRVLVLARLGTPYALGTLGEESGEDTDPVFRLDQADCTVLVVTTAALAHARSVDEARLWMGPLNYRERAGGFAVTYADRLHFTADRITDSPLFEDLTAEVARPAERRQVRVHLNRQATGDHLLPIDWQRVLEVDYVPSALLEPVLDRLPPLTGIAFVREDWVVRGLLVAHEGFLVDGRCLVHASSRAGEVVAVDLVDYLWYRNELEGGRRDRPRFDGVMLYGVRDGEGRVDPRRTRFAAGKIDGGGADTE
jgi:hypothetical protein